MKKPLCFTLPFLITLAAASEPKPIMTTPGKVVIDEDFSGTELPKTWESRLRPECFRIVDGALRCVGKPNVLRSTSIITRLPAHDVTAHFSAKFIEAGTLDLVIDGENPSFAKKTHLVKFELRADRLTIFQKRGSAESKHAQSDANRKARTEGEKVTKPTAEQLADDDFYRSEEIAAMPLHFKAGAWHEVLIEISGSEIVAQFDDQPPLLATAPVADAQKNRMFFSISGHATVLIDNVRVTENTRRADWRQTKTALSQPRKP